MPRFEGDRVRLYYVLLSWRLAVREADVPDPVIAMNGFNGDLEENQDLLIYRFLRWDSLRTVWNLQYQTRNPDFQLERLDALAEILADRFGTPTEGEAETLYDESLGERYIASLQVEL